MNLEPIREYRPSLLSRLGLVLSGLVVAGFGAAIMYPGGRFAFSIPMAVCFGFFPFVLGLLLVGRGFQSSRGAVSILPEGLLVGGGRILRWETISKVEQARSLSGVILRDAAGEELTKLSAGLGRSSELTGGILRAVAAHRTAVANSFEGQASREMRWFALLALVYWAGEFVSHPNAALVGIAIAGLILYWKARLIWKESGRTHLTIDREGIRVKARAGDWEMRWGEIDAIIAASDQRGAIVLQILRTDDRFESVPLEGMDIVGVATALRTYSGALWPRVLVSGAQLLERGGAVGMPTDAGRLGGG